ncbi:TPA: CPBP family intramembrane metalloprotease [Klebsiella pneumoniae]|uniref:CPBP family intramembrane glutamic endopeptidase n=2 Tax=Klebsiella TaxID=570 RepID=UPI0005095438|nr:CPBP family intramembrane metalloprotease [Klebsiella pneumoniae]HBQ2944976.1 CPBP family intramembrane metalloprotease [Klebsiella pneumoniae]HBS7475772.1 CPBP family intramembrane metalloprotease [Klebsiella pneumoniae]HBX7810442.1 CPBP family intramembrane metalloprotease [Klebsiella pneumoniae]HBY2289412.1 CPBP family intramembrane metalloprotease [Klebsiella pneumoniae]
MNRHENLCAYSKYNGIVFLVVVIVSSAATLVPYVLLNYVSLDIAFSCMFGSEFLIATLLYVFYLRKIPGCKLRIKTNAVTVKFSVILFLIIILIQLVVYCYRDYLYHYESSQINLIAVLVAVFVVPYYEEIVYRVCAFGFLCSIFKKNLLIPSLITSVFFCAMHSQYYNVLDQLILFVVSMCLLKVRIKSEGFFYPVLIHSGMNLFVIILNVI